MSTRGIDRRISQLVGCGYCYAAPGADCVDATGRATEAHKGRIRAGYRTKPIILDILPEDEATKRLAIRVALVDLVVNLETQAAIDKAEACEANGWRMSDASGLYDWTIDTIIGLVEGTIDPTTFLETAR